MKHQLTYPQAEKIVEDLILFGVKLGLEQAREFLERVGNPHLRLKFIHIAGTNGKGSVAAMLASALATAGIRTGLYTSPHLVSIRERFRINGKAISRRDFAHILSEVLPAIQAMKEAGRCPTYFEMTTVLAATYFERENVDVVIWETGMGGRFDATNVVDPVCSVITGIGLDHQQHLGRSLAEIANEKAGIIKPGKPVFIGEMGEAAKVVILERAAEAGAECHLSPALVVIKEDETSDSNGKTVQNFTLNSIPVTLPLLGKYQVRNAALAFLVLSHAAHVLGFDRARAVQGFKSVKWPGRLQRLPDGSILDGAHNPQGMRTVKQFLQTYFGNEKFTFIFANFADKNAGESLAVVTSLAEQFFFVPVPASHRPSFTGDALRSLVNRDYPDVPVKIFRSARPALKRKTRTRKVIAGSLYLAGEVLGYYFNEDEIVDLTRL